jgi:GNAT superfamily N-acetyltransferase
MTAGFVIRTPTLADADAVARVHVQGWRETYSELLPPRFYDDAALERQQRRWASVLSRDVLPGVLRVADSGNNLIGVAFANHSRGDDIHRDLELGLIYVLAAHHGTGAGQALLDAVLGDAPAQLWVARDNPRARAFYTRNGFVDSGVQKADPDADGLVDLLLVR